MFTLICAARCLSVCTQRNAVNTVSVGNINDFIGRDRPVFLRMIFSGCEYAPESYRGWQAAAEMYPQIAFLELDCLKDSTAMAVCGDYQAAAQGKTTGDGVGSPFHTIFRAGEKTPVKDAWFTTGSVNGDPNVFVKLITDTLKLSHVEYLKMLTPDSTDAFVKSKTYTAMVLFNSQCQEDSLFIGEWASAVGQDIAPVPPETADISYGRLDCGLFPEECQRWSSILPCVVFHKSADNDQYPSLTVTSTSELGTVVQNAKSQLDTMTSGSLPDPAQVTPSTPDVEDDDGYTLIQNKNLEDRTLDEVKNFYKDYKFEFDGDAWTGTMTSLDQCEMGTSSLSDREQATKNANIVRQLAGVDELSLNDEKFLEGCQRTALVLHKIGYITHYPNVDRTDVCVEGNKAMVAEYAEKSNLAENCASATKSIGLFMEDLGEENAQALGHRRWILNPNVKEIGFGVAPQKSYPRGTQIGSLPINDARPSIVVMRITTPDDQPYTKVNFISWPSAGPFPSEHVPPIWHVSSSIFRDTSITKDQVKIRVTREDGQDIPVKSHFFNRQYMGTPDALLMQMDDNVKELCSAGHEVHVEIWVTNLKKKLDYRVKLFDMKTEVQLCLYVNDPTPCNDYGNRYKESELGNALTFISNSQADRAVIAVGEQITGDIDLTTITKHVMISGKPIDGQVTVGTSATLEIGDPSLTSISILWDMDSGKAGMFTTPGKPKQLQVNLQSMPTEANDYSRIDVYKGQLLSVAFTGSAASEIVDYGDGYMFFGGYINGSTIGVSASYMKYLLALRTGVCASDAKDGDYLINNAQLIEDLKTEGLGRNLGKKKLVRWYVCDNLVESGYKIDSSIFPSDRYQDYEVIVAQSQDTVTFVYDPSMETTIRTIKFQDLEVTQGSSPNNKFSVRTSDNTWIVRHPGIIIKYTKFDVVVDRKVYIPNLASDSSQEAITAFTVELKSFVDSDAGSGSCGCSGDGTEASPRVCEYTASEIGCDVSSWEWYRLKTSGKYAVVHSILDFYDYDEEYGARPNQFLPVAGSESTPIRLRAEGDAASNYQSLVPFISYRSEYKTWDTNKKLHAMVIENYQDITLEVNGSLLQNITYFNVGKVTLDLGEPKEYDEISVSKVGSWSNYLSSVHGITVKKLNVTSDASVQAENAKANHLITSQSSCQLNGLTVTDKWEVIDSFVTLAGATVNGVVNVKKNSRFPRITVDQQTTFNPTAIEYDMGFSSSAKLLDLVTQTTTLLSGTTSQQCKNIVGKVTLVNAPYFEAVCADDGSLQITRTIEDGNQDIGTTVPLPPSEEITEDQVWESTSNVPANIEVNKEVSLSVVNDLNFEISRVEIGTEGKVTAKNMEITQELVMAGGASLNAGEGTKITVRNGETTLNFTVQDGKTPSMNLGEIGEYSAVPKAIQLNADEKISGSKVLVRGRTLNCEDWLKIVQVSGSHASGVTLKCEKLESSQGRILSNLLDEWGMVAGEKDDDGGSPLPPGAVAAIVICVLVVIGVGIAVSIYFIRHRSARRRLRRQSNRIDETVEV